MITIRELNADDSAACISLKKERLHAVPLEIRKDNFFKIYDSLSNESFSFGAFSNEVLVGLCSFVKLENKQNTFLVTDLITAKSFENQRVFLKVFDFANKEIFSKISQYTLVAVEEKINSLELLKLLVEDYSLLADEDQFIYSHLFMIQKEKLSIAESFIRIKSTHPIDENAEEVVIDGQNLLFFTDKKYRSYSINHNIVNRLYVQCTNIDIINLEKVIEAAQDIMKSRSLDYFVILSDKKLSIEADIVYVNRYMSFSKNSPAKESYCFHKGILV